MAASRLRTRIRLALLVFWLGVLGWAGWQMQARGVPDATLGSGARVEVTEEGGVVAFRPVPDTTRAGLLFFPGALVEPKAYAPLARDLAELGYAVTLVPLPFRLAPTSSQRSELFERAKALIGDDARTWVVGGHSRGGALASRFAREHAAALGEHLGGLLLVGTSHPREDDLSELSLDVTKIYGTEDGLASPEEIEQFARNLPPSTHFVRVEGANHRQFGWYGWQFGDGDATITREAQYAATVEAALAQLRRVAQNGAP